MSHRVIYKEIDEMYRECGFLVLSVKCYDEVNFCDHAHVAQSQNRFVIV